MTNINPKLKMNMQSQKANMKLLSAGLNSSVSTNFDEIINKIVKRRDVPGKMTASVDRESRNSIMPIQTPRIATAENKE
ncbi:MAG: hypothetical protein LBU81_01895 [Methanosarcinales archaeon]|nr:hypothetical protein [Methanosarcinales archaeon]